LSELDQVDTACVLCLLKSSFLFLFSLPMYAVSKAVIFMALTHFTIVATGFYETRIAYYSWRGAEGYRFAAIPSY